MGGTECAPCGSFTEQVFHSHCLDAYGAAGGTRCPHCNVFAPAVGLRRVRLVLNEWLDRPAWRKESVFISLQQGLMRGESEEKVLCDAVSHVVSAMQKKNSKVIYMKEKPSSTTVFTMASPPLKTVVRLQRTAVLLNGGLSQCDDGYTLSASRSVIGKRRR
jgi:hypothetical protein